MTPPKKPDVPATYLEALFALQDALPDVGKTKTADTGKYSYDYADLAGITRALRPELTKVGLMFTSRTALIGEHRCLLASLRHITGDGEESTWVLQTRDPQAVGGEITYAKRYLLCAMTGLVPEDEKDDDASGASHAYRQEQRRQNPIRPAPPQNGQEPPPPQDRQGQAALDLAKAAVRIASKPGSAVTDLQQQVYEPARRKKLLTVTVADLFSGDTGRKVTLAAIIQRAKHTIEQGGPGGHREGQ